MGVNKESWSLNSADFTGWNFSESVMYRANLVWDTGTLAWVKMTQPGGGGGGGAVTVADGADVAQGTTTDAAVTTDVAGTVSGKLRGLVKIFASVWDSVNGRLKVDGSAVTQPVSGTFWPAIQPSSIDQTTPGTTNKVTLGADVVSTTEVAPTTLTHNKTTVTTAGTRVQIPAGTCKAVSIKALAANTGTIYVGGATVAAGNGYQLAAGDSVSPDISNSSTLWIDSSVNGEGVSWIAIN